VRVLFALIAVAALLISCEPAPKTGSHQVSASFRTDGGAALSPWLDQRQAVAERLVFLAPSGSDIRQAAVWQPGAQVVPSVLLLVRDYSARQDDTVDPQSVYKVDASGGAKQEELENLPLSLLVAPDRRSVCLALLSQTGVGSFSQERMSLMVWQDSEQPVEVALDDHALPVTYLSEHAVQLRKVDSFQLDGGLLAHSFSRDGAGYLLRMPEMKVDSRNAIYYPNPHQSLAATMKQTFDPADPAAATLGIAILPWPRGGRPALEQYQFPLHVSYSPFPWQPQLHWVNDEQLAALVFMPELAGEGRRANFHGLFKLVVLNDDGALDLVEDHLNGDLPFHASGGVLFYTRRAAVGDTQRWEVWAASADGMYKRLVWNSADPVYISLEDADAGNSLLLHVQTLKVSGDNVSLESKLLSLFLKKPGDTSKQETAPQTAEEEVKPLPEVPEATDAPESPEPGQSSGGPPPISFPKGR